MEVAAGSEPQPTALRLLGAVATWVVATAVIGVAAVALTRLVARGWYASHHADLGAVVLLVAYLALAGSLLTWYGGLRGLASSLGFRYTRVSDLGVAALAWVASLVAGALAAAALGPLLGPPRSNAVEVLSISFDPLFVALVVPTVCILAPAAEELLFRGALYGWLRRRLPVPVAAVLSAAVFAGAHLVPPLFPVLFAFGLATAFIYQRTGSTLNSFAVHACQNTMAVVVAYVALGRAG